ncbi:MAG: YfcE family phosphodiesterase [Candidatus Buchananbacteria bacterium]|nr:YfcE family phosphodiesterase [Candidatus Buchananbacteria bacterium]
MKFAIISDSHDNLPNIYKMLEFLKKENITIMIHCGDVCAPSVMAEIASKFDGQMHLVFGNVDGDQEKMNELAKDLPNLTIYGERGELQIDNKKIGFVHFPWEAETMAKTGKYDLVFYGHDHKAWEKKVGNCTLRNPGTLAGLFSKATFAIYDTEIDKAQLILLERI